MSMTGTWLEEVQQRISHLRERVTKAPEASKADLEMMVDRIADSFKTLAATAEDASNETKAGNAQRLLGSLHGLRVQGEQAIGALKAELRFIEKNLEALKPEQSRPEHGRPLTLAPKEDNGMRRLKGMENRSGRRLAGMREAVAQGFTAVTLYIDGERVQIGDPDRIKMTDDLEGTVEELKKKYRGAQVTVTPTGEREVMIEVERKKGSRLSERSAPTGEDLTHEIESEIGRWLESGEEFELGDIGKPISKGSRGEKNILEANIGFIVRRELENKLGRLTAKDVTVEIEPSGFESSAGEEEGSYHAGGDFRIWHGEDSYAQGSFAAMGSEGELTDMTINITQASGHSKHNEPLRFFG